MRVRMLVEVETTARTPDAIQAVARRALIQAFGRNLITAGILLDDVAPDVNTRVYLDH